VPPRNSRAKKRTVDRSDSFSPVAFFLALSLALSLASSSSLSLALSALAFNSFSFASHSALVPKYLLFSQIPDHVLPSAEV